MRSTKKQKFEDLGLDTKTSEEGYRALNKDGTFNVKKRNVPFLESINIFHSLVSMSWTHFFGIVAIFYFTINIAFASIYMLIGIEQLTGINGYTYFEKFMEAFFFSAQTITTLGYGQVAPIGIPANIVAACESMLGLLLFALATGLMYGRFSKPKATIKYSSHGVIAPYQNINGFMFRVVNPKNNQLVEVEVSVTLSIKKEDSDVRDFHLLELERSKVVFFPTMWTIVHPIAETSPLQGLVKEDLLQKDAEFVVMIKAFDESFSQTVYSRSSYRAAELRWAEKFVYLTQREGRGITVDIGRIDETVGATLNS